jgi:hypothetical protein
MRAIGHLALSRIIETGRLKVEMVFMEEDLADEQAQSDK